MNPEAEPATGICPVCTDVLCKVCSRCHDCDGSADGCIAAPYYRPRRTPSRKED